MSSDQTSSAQTETRQSKTIAQFKDPMRRSRSIKSRTKQQGKHTTIFFFSVDDGSVDLQVNHFYQWLPSKGTSAKVSSSYRYSCITVAVFFKHLERISFGRMVHTLLSMTGMHIFFQNISLRTAHD